MNWIKENFKKTWKWILGVFGIGIAVAMTFSGPIADNPEPYNGAINNPYDCRGPKLPSVKQAIEAIYNKNLTDQEAKTLGFQAVNDLKKWKESTLRGCELAKIGPVPKFRYTDQYFDGFIEILKLEPQEWGVEVFARVWNADGTQIGFGKDGSIDIERFKIVNPPTTVPDGTTHTFVDSLGITIVRDNFKEDLQAAILQSLSHTIKVKKQKSSSSKIVKGKIGSTTTTVYPDASPESTSVDGWTETDRFDETWASIVSRTGTNAVDTDASAVTVFTVAGPTTNKWNRARFSVTIFDTSSIPDTDKIDSATHSGYVTAIDDTPDYGVAMVSFQTTTGSNTAVVAADYQASRAGTLTSDTSIDVGSVTTGAYNDFPLNAAGLAIISKTGVTKLGFTTDKHQSETQPTWQSGEGYNNITMSFADTAGTTQDPKLVIESSAAGRPRRSVF